MNPANKLRCFFVQVDTVDGVVDAHVHGYSIDDVLETLYERLITGCRITYIKDLYTDREETYVKSST
jgi:hypothetical protein